VLYARWTERQPHGGREGGREGYTERMERGEVRERQAVRGGGAEDGESVHTDELEGPFGNRLPEPQYTHTHTQHIYITEELEGRLGNRLQERSRPPRAHGLST
jgi:hypothetical protein